MKQNNRNSGITKKLAAIAAALCMALIMCVSAGAADVTASGGSGSIPVNLSTTSDGTIGGEPAATAMSVTVPTALPMAMNQNGVVTTATDCRIVNNSYGAVRVKSVTISAAGTWKLTAFGAASSLASEKVDSNKLGFALKLGGGTQVMTTTSDAASQTLIASPEAGCYMSGSGDTAANNIPVSYAAIVTPLSGSVTDSTIANIVFIVEWDK